MVDWKKENTQQMVTYVDYCHGIFAYYIDRSTAFDASGFQQRRKCDELYRLPVYGHVGNLCDRSGGCGHISSQEPVRADRDHYDDTDRRWNIRKKES